MDSQRAKIAYYLILVLCIVIVAHRACAQTNPSQGSNQISGNCHLRELELCGATLLMFAQSPGGLATNEQEINKQCSNLRDAESCFRNYTRRCMTPLQRELVNFATNSSSAMLNEYCTRGSQLRNNYLKHSSCINQVQRRELKSCLRDLQPSLDILTSNNPNDNHGKRIQLACCTYNRFESCVANHLDRRCGKETVNFVAQTARRATSRLPETVCRQYKPDGLECRALLPKPGSSSKGMKSNSILARLLSAYSLM